MSKFKEQPPPLPNNNPSCHDAVTADLVNRKCYHVASDMQKRKNLGIERYGVALQPNNGRDMTLDAYEELLDFAVYSKGCVLEGKQEWQSIYDDALKLLIKAGKLMLRD